MNDQSSEGHGAPSEALLRAARTVSEIVWRYVTTHTTEECEELLRQAEAERRLRTALRARPVAGFAPPPPGSPESASQDGQ